MEKFQFSSLAWVKLSGSEAEKAKQWYQGSGWYHNPYDGAGNLLNPQCIVKSESHFSGQIEALNLCGNQGWFVASLEPASPESTVSRIVREAVGGSANGTCFLLQRRLSS